MGWEVLLLFAVGSESSFQGSVVRCFILLELGLLYGYQR